MYNHPPMIPTDLTPEQIVGTHNMQSLYGHMKHFDANGDKPNRKANKEMGEIITRLMEHGYRINGFDKHNNIEFLTVLKSQVQREFEGPGMERLRNFKEHELQRMARNGWRQIMNSNEVSE